MNLFTYVQFKICFCQYKIMHLYPVACLKRLIMNKYELVRRHTLSFLLYCCFIHTSMLPDT